MHDVRNGDAAALYRAAHRVQRPNRPRQNDEGAFGLWAANPHISEFSTIYALHFLIDARERGFAVPPDMLKSGSVDYVCIVDPLRSRIVAANIGSVAAEYFAEVNPDVLVSGWLASGDWVKKNPEAVKGFRLAIDEGLDFIRKNPEEAKAIEKKYIGYNSPSFPTFNNKARPEDLTFFLDVGKELHLYRSQLDPKKIVVP